ncbi:MAG: VOC family protein [Porticoccaceae bacterium]
MGVIELGYLGFSVSDGEAWKKYASATVGMELVDKGEKNRFHLRMDQWSRRITVDVNGKDDLTYIGWRVSDPEALAAMADTLTGANIAFTWGTDEEAEERDVLGLLKLLSPGGVPTEIFHSPQVDVGKPFHPGRPMYGKFLTEDQGIGHVILNEPDVEKAIAFYKLIGMTGGVDYKLALPNGMIAQPVFMSCNERQHSVAFGLGPMEKHINHLMIEYTELDDVGLIHDDIRKQEIDVALQLGKHANDQAVTFYAATPSGWLLEMGWGARKTLKHSEYYRGDIFGHGAEAKGYGMDIEL